MHRLHNEETLSIRPHFDTPNLRLVVDSIIDGKTPAIVWANDLAAPKTVLAWEGRCIYLVGDLEGTEVNKGLREIFSTEIQPEGQSRELGFFKLYYSPDAWSLRLEEIFGALLDNDVERRIYCSVRDSSARIAVPSPPLELRQIDAQLLQSDLAHIGLVRDEILGGWPSFETFLDQGFGFTMLDGASVVCWCTAEYVSEGKCGIGIETIEAYQEKEHCHCGGWRVCQARPRFRGESPLGLLGEQHTIGQGGRKSGVRRHARLQDRNWHIRRRIEGRTTFPMEHIDA